jgi:hypothetical protein
VSRLSAGERFRNDQPDRAERIFGYTAAEVIGQSVTNPHAARSRQ